MTRILHLCFGLLALTALPLTLAACDNREETAMEETEAGDAESPGAALAPEIDEDGEAAEDEAPQGAVPQGETSPAE